MKILVAHNSYQIKGGEDAVVENEYELLSQGGLEVELYNVSNHCIDSRFSKLKAALSVVFSLRFYFSFRKHLKKSKPDVVHVHNYFPLISPSIFYACSAESIPVVHTMHNFRSICPTALLMHDGKVCERSIVNGSWWGVNKRVFRKSLVGTFFLVVMIEFHKYLGTWNKKVNRFIVLTDFAKKKFISAGFEENKLVVKPNFVSISSMVVKNIDEPAYAIYVGRLSDEKGIQFILDSFVSIGFNLKVVGDGPLKDFVECISTGAQNIEYLGLRDKAEVLSLIQGAQFIVMASTCYEGLPMVLVEAFACSTPAIVPALGGMAEVVDDSINGLHYKPGVREDFHEKVTRLISDRNLRVSLSDGAFHKYQNCYSPEINFSQLISVYKEAIEDQIHASKS